MRTLLEFFIFVVVGFTALFVYQNYWDDIKYAFFSEHPVYTLYLRDVALYVTVADEDEERKLGLSGVPSLGDFEGKFFVFDIPAKHGIWMKDMLIPIDVLWFDEDLRVVHIEENVLPNTYPMVFAPDEPARFVLEMNAYFVDTLKIQIGDRVSLPPPIIPLDIKERLQS